MSVNDYRALLCMMVFCFILLGGFLYIIDGHIETIGRQIAELLADIKQGRKE